MYPFLRNAVLGALLVSAGALAAPVTNDDVIKMLGAGLTEALVLQSIESGEERFDTSADGLIRLKKAGASDAVIQRILARAGSGASAGTPPNASSRGDCSVRAAAGAIGFEDPTGFQEIEPAPVAIAAAASAGTKVLKAVTGGLGEATRAHVALEGVRATTRSANHLPTFADLIIARGQDPAEIVRLVRVEVRKPQRLIPLASPKEADATQKIPLARDKLVPLRFDVAVKSCRHDGNPVTVFNAFPSQPLPKGEYALTLGDGVFYAFGID